LHLLVAWSLRWPVLRCRKGGPPFQALSTFALMYPRIFSTDVNGFICNMGKQTSLFGWLLVLRGVELLCYLSDHLECPLHSGEELGLLLDDLAEGFRRVLGGVA
jgi:hypothetical protein